jgi:hypothetical protein
MLKSLPRRVSASFVLMLISCTTPSHLPPKQLLGHKTDAMSLPSAARQRRTQQTRTPNPGEGPLLPGSTGMTGRGLDNEYERIVGHSQSVPEPLKLIRINSSPPGTRSPPARDIPSKCRYLATRGADREESELHHCGRHHLCSSRHAILQD